MIAPRGTPSEAGLGPATAPESRAAEASSWSSRRSPASQQGSELNGWGATPGEGHHEILISIYAKKLGLGTTRTSAVSQNRQSSGKSTADLSQPSVAVLALAGLAKVRRSHAIPSIPARPALSTAWLSQRRPHLIGSRECSFRFYRNGSSPACKRMIWRRSPIRLARVRSSTGGVREDRLHRENQSKRI